MIRKAQLIRISLLVVICSLFSAGAKIPITLTSNRPSSLDNSKTKYFRTMIEQLGGACGATASVGYVFNYEMNSVRNTLPNTPETTYPYTYAFSFVNDGKDFVDNGYEQTINWQIIKDNGNPSNTEQGGFSTGYPTQWMNGYDRYYRSMSNRILEIDSIKMTDSKSVDTIKQWLTDHGNGSANGGIASCMFVADNYNNGTIASGPETGKSITINFGTDITRGHGVAIVGYNDSIRYDINKDGKFTNNIDITGDGKVDLADYEYGAFKYANTFSVDTDVKGIYWMMYRTAALPLNKGGYIKNHVYFCKVAEKYTVKLALKISLSHNTRNSIALSTGVSSNANATSPEKIKTYKNYFTYAGGPFPMCGEGKSETIEIGLDISDLLDSIPSSGAKKFFFIVNSKGGTGKINSVSLMNYTSGTLEEIKSTQTNISIPSGKTMVGISKSITGIETKHVPALIANDFKVSFSNSLLNLSSPYDGHFELQINNLQGKTIFHDNVKLIKSKETALLLPLRSGTYIVSIKNANINKQYVFPYNKISR
jgi:hypothetical protein